MKWMIASDLHGSAYYCRKMLEAFEREGADPAEREKGEAALRAGQL